MNKYNHVEKKDHNKGYKPTGILEEKWKKDKWGTKMLISI